MSRANSHRYAPLSDGRSELHLNATNEMEAAFDDDSDDDDTTESHPLQPSPPSPPAPVTPQYPGSYDFENADYDYPPPGSPPRPSSVALPNDHGNSNGLIPSFALDTSAAAQRRGWFGRTAASILPSHYVERFGFRRPLAGAIGGGTNNDGVFANVTAKPAVPRRMQQGDETFIVPEDARQDAPPSYASAQQDAVPPYWENTVIAPFSPDSMGEMIIDNLPTGSLFSFLWNMLVSISFQFVGFLLTYLLHTTHAARLGSRAGLGVTLIQYGFALRGRFSNENAEADAWVGWRAGQETATPKPTFDTAADAEEYYKNLPVNATATVPTSTVSPGDATTQWLSFFLMTVGWFILLTSLLGYWRVKRWERGILSSQREANPTSSDQSVRDPAIISQFERAFGIRSLSQGEFFRQGLGFMSGRERNLEREGDEDVEDADGQDDEESPMIPIDPNDPDHGHLQQAYANERRLQRDLRAAGLI